MTDATLEIEVIREENTAPVLRLQGELDASTAPRFKEVIATLLADGCRSLVIDTEQLYLLDSAALGILVSLRQRIPGALRIQNPSPVVSRVLESTGTARLFEVRTAEDDQQQLLNFGMDVEESTAVPVVRVRGELDAFSVSHFRGTLISLIQEGTHSIVLHLGELEFVDSVGLGGMVSIYTRLKKAGGGLYLCELSEQIAKVMRITGLDALFPLYATSAEALAAAQANGAAGS